MKFEIGDKIMFVRINLNNDRILGRPLEIGDTLTITKRRTNESLQICYGFEEDLCYKGEAEWRGIEEECELVPKNLERKERRELLEVV